MKIGQFKVRFKYLFHDLHEIWYYIKCVLWYRYNTVKVKTLPPTWNDRDDLLIHSMFQILEDYIKKESHIISWDHCDEKKIIRQKMDELLYWWYNKYLKFDSYKGIEFDTKWDDRFVNKENGFIELKPLSEFDRKKLKIIQKREEQMEKELEEKLIEIIKLRKYLWS